MDALLPCVEVEPHADAGAALSAVIWLHGLGADGHDFEQLVPHLGLPDQLRTRFVLPHAPRRPVTVNMGMVMPAWYDIRSLTLKRDVDEGGVLESSAAVSQLIARERERGIPAERIALVGFSQGGAIALHVALRHDETLAGVLALSTYMVRAEELEAEASDANRKTPIFQAHGTFDPMVPPLAGERARDRLLELGYDVEWKSYPMAHEVHPDEVTEIGLQLTKMLGR